MYILLFYKFICYFVNNVYLESIKCEVLNIVNQKLVKFKGY